MRKHSLIIAGSGIALLFASCQSNRAKQAKVQPSPQVSAQTIVPPQPVTLPTLKVPGMLQTSDSKVPLMPVAVASNRDPFAATTIPTDLKAAIQPASTKRIATKSSIASQPVVSLPQPIIRFTPTQPAPVSVLPTPPMMSPPIPPVSPTHLVDRIALTGVIQTGSNLSAIVQDSDGSSRYVQVGETLANGEVTVKRIHLNSAGDPSIVLQQNGVELIKTVGKTESSMPVGAA